MLTNILLIVILILAISLIVVMVIQGKNVNESVDDLMDNYLHIKDRQSAMLDNHGLIDMNQRTIIAMLKESEGLNHRIELQEKIIAELKENQPNEAVTETMDIISEWMNGAKED